MINYLLILSISVLIFIFLLVLPGLQNLFCAISRKKIFFIFFNLLLIGIFLGGPRSVYYLKNNPLDVLRIIRVVLLVIVFFFLVGYNIIHRIQLYKLGCSMKFYFLFILIAFFSVFYSLYPYLTFWKSFELLVVFLFGVMLSTYINSDNDINEILNIIYLSLLFLVITAFVGILIFPDFAFIHTTSTSKNAFYFKGVFPPINPNTLTQISGITAILSIIKLKRTTYLSERIFLFILFILTSIVLLLSHSRTSILSYLLSLFFVFYWFKQREFLLIIAWIITILLLSNIVHDYILPYIYRGQNTELFLSMSGRIYFWEKVYALFLEHPIIGYGYYAAHRIILGSGTVDNTYLEVLLSVGLIGFSFFVISILCSSFDLLAIYQKTKKKKISIVIELLVLFIFILMRSFTGPSFEFYHINLLLYIILINLIFIYKIIINSSI